MSTLADKLAFFQYAEGLKRELRHSWLSNGRQESVAEHSWSMALMVMILADEVDSRLDKFKCIQMAIIHDLVEIEAGDIPIFEVKSFEHQIAKKQNEETAICSIREKLGEPMGQHIYDLWHEFEAKESNEAKFVNAIDKIEVQMQHNIAPMSTWIEKEKQMVHEPKWMLNHCAYHAAMTELAMLVKGQAIQKLKRESSTALETTD